MHLFLLELIRPYMNSEEWLKDSVALKNSMNTLVKEQAVNSGVNLTNKC